MPRERTLRWLKLLVVITALTALPCAAAGPPEWVRALSRLSLPDYPPETGAVVLLHERRTAVTKSGEIKSYGHVAYKILTPEGVNLAWVRIPFDAATKISELKAWNLKPDGIVHEVTQRDATETQLLSGSGILFSDRKSLILLIPRVEVDSVIAYEYEQRERRSILQGFWAFQQRGPVLRSRFVLELPPEWRFRYLVVNHPDVEPQDAGRNRWVWQLEDLPGIPEEEGMPSVSELAAMLAVAYFPQSETVPGYAFESWDDIARWTIGLMTPRLEPSTAISDAAHKLESREALAEFVQKKIRYVAIEIGIGGYQPHFADQIFRNKYGDRKDKVTLLKSLYRSLEQELYPVLIHSGGRRLAPDFPSPFYFNHMIAALPLDGDEKGGPAVLTHPELGRLLLFDPTDPHTPMGQLPPALQGTEALLVRGNKGYVIETPVAAPAYNRLLRTGHFQLLPDGRLKGEIKERYRGIPGARERNLLIGRTQEQWLRMTERFLGGWLPGVRLESFAVGNLEAGGEWLSETYRFEAPYFGQSTGNQMLIRPSVLGSNAMRLPARSERK